jgi:hypothetical protein
VHLDSGMKLRGIVALALFLGERWFLGLEGKTSASRAEVPVAGGEAEVPNVAFHALIGLGFRFSR